MIYAYILNYKNGKVIERTGEFEKLILYGGKTWMFREVVNGKRTGKYLTSLSEYEGVVRGSTIWFSEPNIVGAIKAFGERDYELSKEYMKKAINSHKRVES